VFHKGAVSEADQAAIVELREAADLESDDGARTNLTVHVFDVDQPMDAVAQALWESFEAPELPLVALRYPPTVPFGEALWAASLGEANLDALRDSPVRTEIAERLLDGDTGVWILLESGDAEQDTAAAKLLGDQLKALEGTLKPYHVPTSPDDDEVPTVTLSMLRLSRDDPKEQVFVNQLLRSEADLMDLEGPMAFPVFGRGRMLYAFVGKGINADTISETCTFLSGQCSCVVKDQNPGTDLLMTANWDTNAGAPAIYEFELPPLAGEAATLPAGAANAPLAPPVPAALPVPEVELPEELAQDVSGTMIRNVIVVLMAVFATLAAITIVTVLRRRTQ
jgi:hypothetical protein